MIAHLVCVCPSHRPNHSPNPTNPFPDRPSQPDRSHPCVGSSRYASTPLGRTLPSHFTVCGSGLLSTRPPTPTTTPTPTLPPPFDLFFNFNPAMAMALHPPPSPHTVDHAPNGDSDVDMMPTTPTTTSQSRPSVVLTTPSQQDVSASFATVARPSSTSPICTKSTTTHPSPSFSTSPILSTSQSPTSSTCTHSPPFPTSFSTTTRPTSSHPYHTIASFSHFNSKGMTLPTQRRSSRLDPMAQGDEEMEDGGYGELGNRHPLRRLSEEDKKDGISETVSLPGIKVLFGVARGERYMPNRGGLYLLLTRQM